MGTITSPGIGPFALAAIFVNIYPAFSESLFHKVLITFSQGSNPLENHLHGCFIGNIFIDLFHNRHIKIIHMKFAETQNLFSKIYIIMKRGKIGIHSINNIGIDIQRDIIGVKG